MERLYSDSMPSNTPNVCPKPEVNDTRTSKARQKLDSASYVYQITSLTHHFQTGGITPPENIKILGLNLSNIPDDMIFQLYCSIVSVASLITLFDQTYGLCYCMEHWDLES